MKLGSARSQAPKAWRLVRITVAKQAASFGYELDRDKLRQARRREGRYLLRTNMTEDNPAQLWNYYLQLVGVEQAFKDSRAISPFDRSSINSRRASKRISSSLSSPIACTSPSAGRLHALAPSLTPRSALQKFAAIQMIDVHVPTTDGRELVLTCYTEPEPELKLLLDKLLLDLPAQPPPKITAEAARHQPRV